MGSWPSANPGPASSGVLLRLTGQNVRVWDLSAILPSELNVSAAAPTLDRGGLLLSVLLIKSLEQLQPNFHARTDDALAMLLLRL